MDYQLLLKNGEYLDFDEEPCFCGLSSLSGRLEGSNATTGDLKSLLLFSSTISEGKDAIESVSMVVNSEDCLPQFFKHVSISERHKEIIVFNLENVNMQVSLFTMRILRNLHNSTHCKVFMKVFEITNDKSFSLLMSDLFYKNKPFRPKGTRYYFSSNSDSGALEYKNININDIACLLAGKTGYTYQGVWGDTEGGYGSYGVYDGKKAPTNQRTSEPANLSSISNQEIDDGSDEILYYVRKITKHEECFTESDFEIFIKDLYNKVLMKVKQNATL